MRTFYGVALSILVNTVENGFHNLVLAIGKTTDDGFMSVSYQRLSKLSTTARTAVADARRASLTLVTCGL
jgi:hypothetical protein